MNRNDQKPTLQVKGGFSRSLKAPIPLPVSATSIAGNNLISVGMTSTRTRERMVSRLREKGISNPHVLDAMNKVPRHFFIDEALASRAYEDVSLPIGFGQTISQPFVVADMISRLLQGRSSIGKTLEVGTGCGYQAAILAQLSTKVYSIERLLGLMNRAKSTLASLQINNVRLSHGDGFQGLTEAAPFDSIIVAAAAESVPQKLVQQLSIGGRLVLPVGREAQSLFMLERTIDGVVETRAYGVKFVPMLPGVE